MNRTIPDPETTACFTGHRTVPPSEEPALRFRLSSALQQAYEGGYRTFMCGGARGFDTLAAEAVICFRETHGDVRLFLAIPCANQASRWTEEEKARRKAILERADEVRVLSETYYDGCMHARNLFMVDASSLCFCWMKRFEGGTWFTVRSALRHSLTVINLAMPDPNPPVFRENIWNCIFTSPSASANALTAPLSLSPLQRKKRLHMSRPSSGKQN